jgi:Tfp pilus assembly protein FimT
MPRVQSNANRGFSTSELLVVMALFSIMGGIGLLSFREFQGSFRKSDARNQFEADVRRARNDAVATGGRTIVAIANDGRSYSVGRDLLPYSEPASADQRVFLRALPDGITLSSNRTIIFNPRGYVISSSGDYSTATVTFSVDGSAYFIGNLYSTGTLS